MTAPHENVEPVPAATILMLRDGARGLEVLMLQRSTELKAFSGALVFPGGKVTEDEASDVIKERSAGVEDMPGAALAFRAAAIREAFEEVGLLLAREAGSAELVGKDRITGMEAEREALSRDEMRFDDFLVREDLSLATDLLVPFGHWITPPIRPRRFDTWFYLAAAPAKQMEEHAHDGTEATESLWVTPQWVLEEHREKRRSVVFVTVANLMRLAESRTVEEALATARRRRITAVMPDVVKENGETYLRIGPEHDYPITQMALSDMPAL